MRASNTQGSASDAAREGVRPSKLGLLGLIPLAGFITALYLLITGGGPYLWEIPWFSSVGIDINFRLDGLAMQFVLLITGIGALVFLYAAGYMAGTLHRRRLFTLLLLFMFAMLGCVLSDNLILLFIFWELTSLTSFLLIGFKYYNKSAQQSALQALLITAGGGLALLAGFILLGNIAGTYQISEMLGRVGAWRDDPRISAAVILLIIGAATKSAQLPFHFWLPNAMTAPTPVSAYLHSATMVKLGVYLLARFEPAFDDFTLWSYILVPLGATTALWSMVLTLRERDLKRILAWSTVSALGTLIMLIGQPGERAAIAMGAFLLAHALYKAPLFFVAGNIDHCTGTRQIDRYKGLAPRMPWTAFAATLAALSMAGMPFSMGFVAKDLIDFAKKEGGLMYYVTYSSIFVNAITVAVASVAAIRIFWRRGGEQIPPTIHEAHWTMRIPPLLIAMLGITLGSMPWLITSMVQGTALSLSPGSDFAFYTETFDHAHPWSAILTATILGVLVFVFWDHIHRIVDGLLRRMDRVAMSAWYERALAAIPRLAGFLTRRIQSGKLTSATFMVLGFSTLLVGVGLWMSAPIVLPQLAPPTLAIAGASVALIVASIAICIIREPFILLLVSGFIGIGSALLFVFFSAPDLAFTQFAVEVAFVVVIASILIRLRRLGLGLVKDPPVLPRAIIAVATSAVLVLMLLVATAQPFDTTIPDFYAEASYPEAFGRNVVNVILVDFRAVDTLGEIAVVAVAFLAALPMLALLRERKVQKEESQ